MGDRQLLREARPPCTQGLSRDSCSASPGSRGRPLAPPGPGQGGGGVSGEACECPGPLRRAWTAAGPPTPPPYQGSGKDKECPRLSPEAHRDQPAEGRAEAPLVWGDRVWETVHSKPRHQLPSTPERSFGRPRSAGPGHPAAWLMSKGPEEGPPRPPVGRALRSCRLAHWPQRQGGQDRALGPRQSIRLTSSRGFSGKGPGGKGVGQG